MKTIPLTDLLRKARRRPAGYVEHVLSLASEMTTTHYTLSDEAYEQLKSMYRSPEEATVEKSPCVGCGDKTNIAQVKSSPAAMEGFLASDFSG